MMMESPAVAGFPGSIILLLRSTTLPWLPSVVKMPGAAGAIMTGCGTEMLAPRETITCCVVFAEMLTGPPTEDQVTFARWFGFASLFVGLVLIVAIYWSFLLRFFY